MVNLAERPPLFASALLFKLAAGGLASVMHASEPWFRDWSKMVLRRRLKEFCVRSIYESSGF